MALCVPMKELRDTATFASKVASAAGPVTVTKNGYDQFVCVRSRDFERYEQADARARLLERILISEQERAQGSGRDARDVIAELKGKYDA